MTMVETVRLALKHDVVIGAHPGYPDRENFGRKSGYLAGDALYDSLKAQVAALAEICAQLGAILSHVKPHGALYNDSAVNQELAEIIAKVTLEFSSCPTLMGMADSAMQIVAEQQDLNFIPEGFVDRAYASTGMLVPRGEPDAVHTDVNAATNQAAMIAETNTAIACDGSRIEVAAETLCIHGDTPGAARAARAIRKALERKKVLVRAYQNR